MRRITPIYRKKKNRLHNFRTDSLSAFAIPTPLSRPNAGEFSRCSKNTRCAGIFREWDGSLHYSAAHHSHSFISQTSEKIPVVRGFFESGMDRFIIQPHIIPTQ